MTMKVEIDKHTYDLIVDTGFGGNIALSRNRIKTSIPIEFDTSYKVLDRKWKYKMAKFKETSIISTLKNGESSRFNYNYIDYVILDEPELDSMLQDNVSGLMGLPMLSKIGDIVEISYSDKELNIYERLPDLSHYHSIDFKNKNGLIYIKNKKDSFLIDTGSSMSRLKLKSDYYTSSEHHEYKNIFLSFDFKVDDYLKTDFVIFKKQDKESVLGSDFIEEFNVIIDFKNKKLYFKNIKTSETE